MWRKVFVRTGFCAARVHTRRRRSGRGCRAGPPGTAGAGSRGHSPSLPCLALRSALRLAVQASVRPRHGKSLRAVTRDVLEPVARDLRVGPSADTRDVAILMVAKSRPCASTLPTRVRCLCSALRSSSAAPRRRQPMRRAGRFWSGRRSRRCGNGFSAPTSRRGRCSGRSTGGRGRGPGADASVDQPHR
jgi:hypothetical protein